MLDIRIIKQLDRFNLDITIKSDKKLISIIGKSGSGKSTFIRCISGFENCDGKILINGKEWKNLPIQKRNFGIVFQDYALFPNMTVYENLKFANPNKKEIEKIIKIMELEGLEKRYPFNLSGGEKQRVSLGRAIINNPDVLLLDEPFSALNIDLKQKLYKEIKTIKENFNTQIILISHDLSEVHLLSDEIIEIENGKIINKFTPNQIPNGKIIRQEKGFILTECGGKIYKIELNQNLGLNNFE